MKRRTSLRNALSDSNLLGRALAGDSWAAWRALLLASMGEKLRPAEFEHYKRLTGRADPPSDRVSELWVIAGRRGGKSRAIATLLCYIACLCDHKAKLVAGEKGIALCLAPSQAQAEVVLGYVGGILRESPILKQLIVRQTSEAVELDNGITIEVRSASFRRLRGPTLVAVVLDELAFFHSDESANPDIEIINAVRPALGTTSGLLACISSPYARRGELWNAYKSEYGDKGDPSILVARGSTRDLNPSYEQSKIDREYERDSAYAAAEYGGEFRTDVETFLAHEVVGLAIVEGVFERPYEPRHKYVGFVDPSGGSGDSFTLAIAHKEGETSVIDVVRERKAPCEPPMVVEEFSHTLRRYHVNTIEGDHYAGEWPKSVFQLHGITYQVAELTKSEIYRDALPLLMAARRFCSTARCCNGNSCRWSARLQEAGGIRSIILPVPKMTLQTRYAAPWCGRTKKFISASGTVGRSFIRHPGIRLSRDACPAHSALGRWRPRIRFAGDFRMSAEIVNLDEARIIRDIMEDALRDGVPGWRDLQVSEQWQASLSK